MGSSSRLKGTSKTNSRRRQDYGPGSSSVLDYLKNSALKTATKTQITRFKAQEATHAGPLKRNEEFWEEAQGFDGAIDDDDNDAGQVGEVLEGSTTLNDSNAGDWADITGEYWGTDSGKR